MHRWTQFFAWRGHEVHLLTTGAGPSAAGIVWHRLPGGEDDHLGLWRMVRIVGRMLAEVRPDVVHAHWLVVYGWIPWLTRARPYVITPWGSDAFHLIAGRARARLLTFGALRGAGLVTASSQALLAAAVRLGASPARCHLVRWGVDTQMFHPGVTVTPHLRRLGVEGQALILNPRGPAALYAPDLALAAMERVRSQRTDAVLVQITRPDHPDHAPLAARAARDAESVRLVPALPHEEMPALMAGAAIVLALAATDSTSVSLLEGMASGCVPVAVDIPANRECITDGENGLLVRPGDAAGLAGAILRALEDDALRRRCRERNPAWVRDHAEFATHMETMEHLYQGICAY